jgi:hypothetical protein
MDREVYREPEGRYFKEVKQILFSYGSHEQLIHQRQPTEVLGKKIF